MRGSQSASTNIEEEVDMSSGPIINHEHSRLHYQQQQQLQQQQQQQQRNRGGPNLIYSPGFSNTLVDGVQVLKIILSNIRLNKMYTSNVDDELNSIQEKFKFLSIF